MEEALSFFRAFEVWIYVLLGIGGLIYTRKFLLAWQELQVASFGLERENAQSRLNQAAVVLVLLLTMTVSEFVLVSFVAPTIPGATPLPTPTLNLLATTTVPVAPAQAGTINTPAAAPQEGAFTSSGCVLGQIEISSPAEGQEVGGVVEVQGTAEIPNFGFYKIEMKRPSDLTWLTLQAGNTVVKAGKLGDWDTRRLNPGDYQLGLVVVDNQARLSQPCTIQVRVIFAPDVTPGP